MSQDKEKCRQQIRETAKYFRLGMEAQASDSMVAFIDAFVPLLQGGELVGAHDVRDILGELLQAQARKDYLRVADLLEYEIVKMFN